MISTINISNNVNTHQTNHIQIPSAASNTTVTTSVATTSTSSALSKTVYDSLAPLNLPSKPIIYQAESSESESKAVTSIDDSRMDEKAKLESILLNSMAATAVGVAAVKLQTDIVNVPTNRYGVTSWPRPQGNINPGRPVPSNFRCSICKKTGHAKNVCPEAHLIPKSEERHKFPSGIPKTNLRPAQPGDKFAMLGPDGYVVSEIEQKAAQIKKKDKPSFMDEDEESKGEFDAIAASGGASKIPQELKCPYGEHLLKDAVIIPCCGHFVCCDQCIREKISNDEVVECPNEACDQEIGSLTTITPFHEMRRKVNDYLNDLKLANQRAQLGLAGSDKKSSSDAFYDLILSGVDETSQSAIIKTSPNINAEINEESNNEELNKENKIQESQQIKTENQNEEIIQARGNESPSAIEYVSSPSEEAVQLTESSATKSTTILSINNENQKQISSKIETTNSKQYSSSNLALTQPQQQPALLPAPPQMNPIIPTQMPPYTRPPLYTSENFMQRPPSNIINPMQGYLHFI
jgi:hypothetical protein